MSFKKTKNWLLIRELVDDKGKWFRRPAHKLSPTMSCDVYGVMDIHTCVQALFHNRHIDMCGRKQRLPIGTSIGKFREISMRKFLRNFTCERKPVGMDTQTFNKND